MEMVYLLLACDRLLKSAHACLIESIGAGDVSNDDIYQSEVKYIHCKGFSVVSDVSH